MLLDLMRELGDADDRNDRGSWDMPSIAPHPQNRGFHEWVVLIEILRESWIATLHNNPAKAQLVARNWFTLPYPIFKRLALYAATFDKIIPHDEWVSWLSGGDGWWLWSVGTKREVMRLLVLQGAHLPDSTRSYLEARILVGPPRHMFRSDIEEREWARLVNDSVWLRLMKLTAGGAILGSDAATRLSELSAANPQWKLEPNERDEFSHWMSGTGDPDYVDRREFNRAPGTRRELVTWLRRPPPEDPLYEDDWRIVCLENFPLAACALYALAREDVWPEARWREALQAWSSDRHLRRSWRYMAPVLALMPEEQLLSVADSATWWLESASKVLDQHLSIFVDLCLRYLGMRFEGRNLDGKPVNVAINHPVGHIADALLNQWFQRKPNDDEGLPDDLKPLFTSLCDRGVTWYRPARVLFAAHVVALFRVDPLWTSGCVLPLFDWQQPADEVRGAWAGFLWSPRLYRPLLVALKADFLITANHYVELDENGPQYAALLTYVSLDPADTFTVEELASVTNALPQQGLLACAQALVNALDGAGDQREEQWKNRVRPYWHAIWPKSRELMSQGIAEQLARLAIAAGGQFPSALMTVRDWLQPIDHIHYVMNLLQKSSLCSRFPKEALDFIDGLIDNQPWLPYELQACLTDIRAVWPEAAQDKRYQRVMDHIRRRG